MKKHKPLIPTPPAKQIVPRQQELQSCMGKINALLEQSSARLTVTQTMTLGEGGAPRYSFAIGITNK